MRGVSESGPATAHSWPQTWGSVRFAEFVRYRTVPEPGAETSIGWRVALSYGRLERELNGEWVSFFMRNAKRCTKREGQA